MREPQRHRREVVPAGDHGEARERLVHAAELGREHRLERLVVDVGGDREPPVGQARHDLERPVVAGDEVRVDESLERLVQVVPGHPVGALAEGASRWRPRRSPRRRTARHRREPRRHSPCPGHPARGRARRAHSRAGPAGRPHPSRPTGATARTGSDRRSDRPAPRPPSCRTPAPEASARPRAGRARAADRPRARARRRGRPAAPRRTNRRRAARWWAGRTPSCSVAVWWIAARQRSGELLRDRAHERGRQPERVQVREDVEVGAPGRDDRPRRRLLLVEVLGRVQHGEEPLLAVARARRRVGRGRDGEGRADVAGHRHRRAARRHVRRRRPRPHRARGT